MSYEVITVKAKLLFTIKSKTHWVNKFGSHLLPDKDPGEHYIYLDANGNALWAGIDFSATSQAGAFPVKVYHLYSSRRHNHENGIDSACRLEDYIKPKA